MQKRSPGVKYRDFLDRETCYTYRIVEVPQRGDVVDFAFNDALLQTKADLLVEVQRKLKMALARSDPLPLLFQLSLALLLFQGWLLCTGSHVRKDARKVGIFKTVRGAYKHLKVGILLLVFHSELLEPRKVLSSIALLEHVVDLSDEEAGRLRVLARVEPSRLASLVGRNGLSRL